MGEKVELVVLMMAAVNTYLAYPPDKKTEHAILYLTDVFGLPLVNNKL